jgi:ABC-2 type transport system ATP-binding protein
MLELVGRLSTFGISVLFATHLLDDVQRVCDHVVMVDAGRLVIAGPVEQLVERTGTVRVEVGGRPAAAEALSEALSAQGFAVTLLDAETIDVDTSARGDEVFDAVRDACADLGLRLYGLSSRHRSLDELFVASAGSS